MYCWMIFTMSETSMLWYEIKLWKSAIYFILSHKKALFHFLITFFLFMYMYDLSSLLFQSVQGKLWFSFRNLQIYGPLPRQRDDGLQLMVQKMASQWWVDTHFSCEDELPSYIQRWEFIKENKKVRKQENKTSTKKAIKKTRIKTRTRPRKRSRKQELDQESDQENKSSTKKATKKKIFFSWSLSWSSSCFLVFLPSCFLL